MWIYRTIILMVLSSSLLMAYTANNYGWFVNNLHDRKTMDDYRKENKEDVRPHNSSFYVGSMRTGGLNSGSSYRGSTNHSSSSVGNHSSSSFRSGGFRGGK